jgi:hypothetical protein
MNFRLEFTPRPFNQQIKHHHKIFLAGSCFTEQMGAKLNSYKFRTIENPNGIMFNPVSISQSIHSYIEKKIYNADDLFLNNELWGSWNHHTRFSSIHLDQCLSRINESQNNAHYFLKSADWLLLTLGSSFVYELKDGRVVANCHKVPTDKFNKRLLEASEVTMQLQNLIDDVKAFNPTIKIIFTISPVRHLRDGFIENNRSKANLIQAVHSMVNDDNAVYYFPAYELIIDDLRDYRFFAEDMVHPNYAATNYVWEKFNAACIDSNTQLLMKEIGIIKAARNHKPFNPASEGHKRFCKLNIERAQAIQSQYEYIDFSEEIEFFKAQ